MVRHHRDLKSRNLDNLDTVTLRLLQAGAIVELLISNFEGSRDSGSFALNACHIHEAHSALDTLLEQAISAARAISFAGETMGHQHNADSPAAPNILAA